MFLFDWMFFVRRDVLFGCMFFDRWGVLFGGMFCRVWCGVIALCVLFGGMCLVWLSCWFVCAAAWLSFCLAVFLLGCTVVLVWL